MPTLTIDRKCQNVTRINNGAFARIYKNDNDRIFALVDTDKGDFTKKAVADWADSNNPHIPQIEREHNDNNLSSLPYIDFYVYSMPFYSRPKGDARKTARQLIKLWKDYILRNRINEVGKDWLYAERMADFLESIQGKIDSTLWDGLESIYKAMCNLSQSINFDFHMGNFAQDDNGTLILLDVIFDITATQGMS